MDRDSLQQTLNAAADLISESVIPLLVFDDHSRLVNIGSGVLMIAGPHRCVVTAGHVIDSAGEHAVLTRDSAGEIIGVGALGTMTEPARPHRHLDPVDLAMIFLSASCTEALIARSALFLEVSALSERTTPDTHYVAIGFPASRNKSGRERSALGGQEKVFAFEQTFAYSRAATDGDYASAGANPALQFVTRFDHSRTIVDGSNRGFPHPRGMSGGGLFRLASATSSNERYSQPELVGIGTRYVEKRGLIVATRANYIRQLLTEAPSAQQLV